MNRLDTFLLSRTQWLVDKIGGDYIGQRIGQYSGATAYFLIMLSYLLDYRFTGSFLTALCLCCAYNAYLPYRDGKTAMRALYKGFANPSRDDIWWRFFMIFLTVMTFAFPPWTTIWFIRSSFLMVYSAAFYFIATENPPPKKIEQTSEQDVSLLKPICIKS